jgi:hypothetical protein
MVRKLARKVTAETDVRRALGTLTLNEISERSPRFAANRNQQGDISEVYRLDVNRA